MKTKSIIFGLIALFGLFLMASFASALTVETVSVPANVSHNAGTVDVSFNLTNNGASPSTVGFTTSTLTSGTGSIVEPNITLAAGASSILNATITFGSFQTGNLAGTINAVDQSSNSASLAYSIAILSSTTLSLTNAQSMTVVQNGTVNVTNTGNVALTNINLSSTGDFTPSFSANNFALAAGVSRLVNVTKNNTDFEFGDNTITITSKDLTQTTATASLSYTVTDGFCSDGEVGELEINEVEINTDGDDDDIWRPLDEVTVKVKVENTDGSDEIGDVVVELGLFDSDDNNVADDLTFNTGDEEISIGDLNDGDEESVTFVFKVPADFDAGDYKLSVKAYGDDDGEDEICTDESDDLDNDAYEEVEIESEDDEGKFIAFDNILVNPKEVTCGDTVSLSTSVFNIGDEDQDQVKVSLSNTNLKLDQEVEIKQGIEKGEKDFASFSFIVPQGLTDGTYQLALSSEYDYSNGEYREISDDSTKVSLKLIGCVPSNKTKAAAISASLDTDSVRAGKDLEMTITITNTDSLSRTFVIDAKNFESWANLDNISDKLITLKSGESKEVKFKFKVLNSAEGEESFTVETVSGDKVDSRQVAVNIEKSSIFSSLTDNYLLWIIGIVNAVLIITIVVIAIRAARR